MMICMGTNILMVHILEMAKEIDDVIDLYREKYGKFSALFEQR